MKTLIKNDKFLIQEAPLFVYRIKRPNQFTIRLSYQNINDRWRRFPFRQRYDLGDQTPDWPIELSKKEIELSLLGMKLEFNNGQMTAVDPGECVLITVLESGLRLCYEKWLGSIDANDVFILTWSSELNGRAPPTGWVSAFHEKNLIEARNGVMFEWLNDSLRFSGVFGDSKQEVRKETYIEQLIKVMK